METKERILVSDKVKYNLKIQGRKKAWLADTLNMSRPTLDKRLKNNHWESNEIDTLKKLKLA